MNKPMLPILLLALIVALLACQSPAPVPGPSPDSGPVDAHVADAAALGRAGPVTLDLAGVRAVIARARVLNHWRRGEPPDTAALKDPGLRRQVVIQGLETAVVGQEFARRGLSVEPQVLNQALENAARGRPADAPAPEPDPDTLDARLAARYGAPPAVVREAVVDVLRAAALAEALVQAAPEAEVEADWRAENTRLELDVVQIPRVPSSAEITRFVQTRGDEIDLAYDAQRGRFNMPERAVVHRIVVADRAQAEALRKQLVADPSTFADVARTHSNGPNARAGGRLGALSAKKLPLAFELEPGAISAPTPLGEGWALYRVERRLPAQSRPLSDPSVRRELAAELLRKADELPHAKQAAQRIRQRLLQAPDGEQLKAAIKAVRARRHQTKAFDLTARAVPGIGLAPDLLAAAQKLTPQAPVSAVLPVRQNYVVVRLIKRHEPPRPWAEAKAEYNAKWRARMRPRIVDRWLSTRLKSEPLWVDVERLKAIPLEDLL